MKGLRGADLNMPLTHSKYLKLQEMFSSAQQDVVRLAEQQNKAARDDPDGVKQSFKDLPLVKRHHMTLKFLAEH